MAKKKAKQKSSAAGRKQNRNLFMAASALALAAIVVAAFVLATQGGDGKKPSVRGSADITPVVFTEQQASVKVVDNDYSPRAVRVPVGATITWQFEDKVPHTVTDPSGVFDSGTLGKGESFEYTFSSAGQFDYYCILHHIMTGTVFVGP